jgi:hypothetical protein
MVRGLLWQLPMKTLSVWAKAMGVVLVFSAASFADSDPGSQTVQYDGSQSDYSFSLKNDISQTIYESKEVPDTCSREVPDGTESQCHTQTDKVCGADTIRHVCENTSRQVCENVTKQECGPVNQRECQNVNRNVCRNESHRECSPVSRQECSTRQECRQGPHGQDCHPVQECRTVTDQSCHDVSQQVCQNEPEQECHDVSHNECRNVTDQVCHSVPDTVCHDDRIPNCHDESKNVCVDVPKTRHETYACTKTIQVAVGTELISSDVAQVSMHIDPSAIKAGDAAEQFVCDLSGGTVGFELGSNPVSESVKDTLLIQQVTQKSVSSDAKHRQITAQIGVRGVNLEEVELPLTQGVEDVSLTATTLQFSVAKISLPELLKLQVQVGQVGDGTTVVAPQAVDLSKAKLSAEANGRTLIVIDLSQLGVAPTAITPGAYQVEITGALAIDAASLLNPTLIANPPTLSKTVAVTVDYGVSEISQIFSGGIQNVALTTSQISFELGTLKEADFVTVHLKIQKNKFIGHDNVIDQDLTNDQVVVENASATASKVTVALNTLDKGKYKVDVTVTPNADVLSKFLTAEQMAQLKAITIEKQLTLN